MHKSPKRIASVAVYNADFPFLLHIKNFLLIALIWPKDKEALASCWNCGRKASETCSGCNTARYCGSFCQHKDWEKHHHVCGQTLQAQQQGETPSTASSSGTPSSSAGSPADTPSAAATPRSDTPGTPAALEPVPR
ncbi:protein CBFA2T1 isoform X1 [Tachysurus ichikawai]